MIGFNQLFEEAGVLPDAIEGDASVSTLVMDSRKAVTGCCFVCMPSESTDSHTFLNAAKEAGAVAAIVHSQKGFDQARSLGLAVAYVEPSFSGELPDPSTETPEQRIRRTTGAFSESMWRLAKVAFGDPSAKLQVIGVTGTNGKTTTAWLIRDMLNLLGIPCAYVGTLGFGLPKVREVGKQASISSRSVEPGYWTEEEELRPLANTTPFSIELNAMLAECVERGCWAVAMEVSSHALAERRADGIEFDVAVFTNLTQDHLDYHGSMEAYRSAKERLFDSGLPRAAINVGDEEGIRLASQLGPRAIRFLEVPKLTSFGDVDSRTEVEGCAFSIGLSQIHLVLQSRADGDVGFIADLGGGYNVENLIAAVTAVSAVGIPLGKITEAITTQLRPVPGRFEPVPNDSGIGIIVDYAHTPDALEKLLATVRPLTQGKVITVFGCGGDRDKSKRPLMARAAEQGSDIVVVTSDNPRTEDPMAIIGDILMGIVDCGLSIGESLDFPIRNPQATIHIHPDRPAAVALAIALAEPGDAVVIAGKGHENYQIIGRTKYDMDDRELARQGLLRRRQG